MNKVYILFADFGEYDSQYEVISAHSTEEKALSARDFYSNLNPYRLTKIEEVEVN